MHEASLPCKALTFACAILARLPLDGPPGACTLAGSTPAARSTLSKTSYGHSTSETPKSTRDFPFGRSKPSHLRTASSAEYAQHWRCKSRYSCEIRAASETRTRRVSFVQSPLRLILSSCRCLISNRLLPVCARYSSTPWRRAQGSRPRTATVMANTRSVGAEHDSTRPWPGCEKLKSTLRPSRFASDTKSSMRPIELPASSSNMIENRNALSTTT
mmetsp:Transcript_17381/g.48011  ORF Transcript_17381/g.48011 Transcript_17381/m.48011 type:complete len:216 (-) Transcript_17381:96-743(-)